MPVDGLDALRGMDAILFGSAGDPHIPDHITRWGLRLKICQGFDQYANVRPTRILPGIDGPLKRCTPEQLNWVIVRENSEGEYSGVGGRVHQGHPIEAATDVSMMTRAGVERIMRYAFRTGPVPHAQAADRCRQIQCTAPRNGDVGRDCSADIKRVSRRHLGQGTGRRLYCSHGESPGYAGHRGGHQPARRHPERLSGCTGMQPGQLPPPATLTRSAAIHPCSSPSTDRPST